MNESVPESGVVPEAGAGVPAQAAQDPRDAPDPWDPQDAPDPDEHAHDPAAPSPLDVERTPTGSAEVDAQLDRLGDADHLATDGHLEVYEDVHRGLRDALTALDARPGPPAPPSYDRRS
ncbi:hypothetical protein [Streptomyces sp. NPDC058108]|uniref:hypothetical protein n=1 Tax=unclassified Streptomyces TaxID=2593676 RepID=UPI0036E1871C